MKCQDCKSEKGQERFGGQFKVVLCDLCYQRVCRENSLTVPEGDPVNMARDCGYQGA
jgi:hypothetical protein